jgi:mono/diheme cytochrome c family protein
MLNFVCCVALVSLLTSCSIGGTSRREARALKNPVEPAPESIAAGKSLYEKHCVSCHGVTGKGDGEKAAALIEKGQARPSNLTDDKWDHGSTDGEIFVNIREGVGVGRVMEGLSGKPEISSTEIWNLVNYVRTLKAH